MSNHWFEVERLYKNFDGIRALDGFSCTVQQGEILGLIGPNGAGKTTLFNIITGFISQDQGIIKFKGVDLSGLPPYRIVAGGISRTFQTLRLLRHLSVLDNVLFSFKYQPGERLKGLFFNWKTSKSREKQNRDVAISLLEEAGLGNNIYDLAENLSYGQQKLLTLICCLSAQSELLLLDEPVAGIAPGMIEKILLIIQNIPKQGRSVLLIEHNIDAVMSICNRVIFIEAGAKVSEGSPQDVRNDPRVIDAYLD